MGVQIMNSELVEQFWSEVEKAIRGMQKTEEQALRGIVRFRNHTERVGELTYHSDPSQVAEDIVEGGYCENRHASRR